MKRFFYEELLKWKDSIDRKPLIVFGARQVGKTYTINEFCQKEFKTYRSINLFQDKEIVELYLENKNSEDKFNKLKAYCDIKDFNKDTILFIDEIQESEELISDLKYICEKHNDLRIICAGSLLGVKLKRSHKSFPVGKVNMLSMYPMRFDEFLDAFDKHYLVEEIRSCYSNNSKMMESYHSKCLDYYRLYICSGGMPEAVNQMVNVNGDITKFNSNPIKDIITGYFDDMKKYVTNMSESLKIEDIYKSLPTQLGNSSNKFQANVVSKGSKLKEYDLPINWLLSSKLVLQTTCVNPPLFPLRMHLDNEIFKLYLSDAGILVYMLNIPYKDIYLDTNFIEKGIISENYVANQLTINGFDLIYWKSERNAEVDFVVQMDDSVIPIEVKAAENTQSKSLKVYVDKYHPKYSIRISTKNFGFNNGIKSIPLYAVFCLQ